MTGLPCPYAPCPRCRAEVDDWIPARLAVLRAEYDRASDMRADAIRAEYAALRARLDVRRATAGPGTSGRTAMDVRPEPAVRPAKPIEIFAHRKRRKAA